MKKPINPCYGCELRTMTCHGNCPRKAYEPYLEELAAYNDHVRIAKERENDVISYMANKMPNKGVKK